MTGAGFGGGALALARVDLVGRVDEQVQPRSPRPGSTRRRSTPWSPPTGPPPGVGFGNRRAGGGVEDHDVREQDRTVMRGGQAGRSLAGGAVVTVALVAGGAGRPGRR